MSFPDGEEMAASGGLRLKRLANAIPSSYTIFKIGDTYYAETNIAGGTNYDATEPGALLNNVVGALSNGGHIAFREGTYPFTTTSELDGASESNITISGAGSSTIFTMGTELAAGILRLGISSTVSNVTLRDIKFNDSGYSRQSLYVNEVNRLKIEGCTFTGYKGIAGWLAAAETAEQIDILNCDFDTLTNHAALFSTANYATFWDGIRFQGNRFKNVANMCLTTYEAKNIDVSHNVFRDCERGILSYVVNNGVFNGNRFVDCPTDTIYYGAIDVSAPRGSGGSVTIGGNTILWTANPSVIQAGIVVHSEYDAAYILSPVSVTDNVIDGGGFANCYNGIYFHGKDVTGSARRFSATGNAVENMAGAACSITWSKDATISDNFFEATLYGLHLAGSSHCIAKGNRVIGGTTGLRESGAVDYNTLQGNDASGSGTAYDVSGANNTYDEKIISDAVLINGATTTGVMSFVQPAWLARARLLYETAVANDTNVEVGYGDVGGVDRDKYVASVTSGTGAIWETEALTLLAAKDIGALDTVTLYQDGSGGAGEYIRLIIDVLYGA